MNRLASLLISFFSTLLLLPLLCTGQSSLQITYKKFTVPNEASYGRWVSSPEMKRQMREQMEFSASNVKEYYTLHTDGRHSHFQYDTTITLKEQPKDERTRWRESFQKYKATYYSHLASGNVIVRQEELLDTACKSQNFREEYDWKAAQGTKVFLDVACQKLYHLSEEGDTTHVWYAPSIPIPSGPAEYGGAPGLILAIEAPTYNYIAEKISQSQEPVIQGQSKASDCLSEKKFDELVRKTIVQQVLESKD